MMYSHGIVGTQGGALLQEHASAPVACSGSKTPRVYRPLVKGDINFLLMLVNGQPKLFYDTKNKLPVLPDNPAAASTRTDLISPVKKR